MKSFQGIFYPVHTAHVIDLEKCPFISKTYLLAAMLDPNCLLYWVDAEIDLEDSTRKCVRRAELKGKYLDVNISQYVLMGKLLRFMSLNNKYSLLLYLGYDVMLPDCKV